MSENIYPILDSYAMSLERVSKTAIEELRQKFIERVDQNVDQYYPKDVDKVKTNDWYIRRYLYNYKSEVDVNKGLEALDKAMKWRKSFGVLDLSDKDFTKEGYISCGAILYGKDLNGSQIMIMRGKLAKKIKSWMKTAHQYLVYLIEKADQSNDGKGLTILMDCRETGIKNADMDTLKFLHLVFNEYYPGLVNSSLVYKMPAVLEAVYKMVRTWLSEEQNKYVYFVSKKNINQYVAVDQLPDLMLGTNSAPYRTVPEEAPTAHQLAERLGIKPEKADKLVKHLEKFYEN